LARFSGTAPVSPNPYRTTAMHTSMIASPTRLRMKNNVYSRRMCVRARCRNVQCRFMKYEAVAEMVVETACDVSGPTPAPKCSRLKTVKSMAVFATPTAPNLAISAMSTRHWARTFSTRVGGLLTGPRVREA